VVVSGPLDEARRAALTERLRAVDLPGPLELELAVAGRAVAALVVPVTAVLARGRTLAGPPPADVLPEVPWTTFLESVLGGFDAALDRSLHEGGAATAGAVLAVCRVLAMLSSPPGTVLGKEEGGAWALERLPPEHRPVVEAALATRADPASAPEWDADALRRFRTFVVGAAVRRRPGRKVAGLP
jgi:hypothetical protein